MDSENWMRLAWIAGSTVSIALCSTAATSVGSSSMRSVPRTIRDMSSRSSSSVACARALRSSASSAWRLCASSIRPVFSSRAQPSTPVAGVRSSCESVARNSSFNRLAASAVWRASRSRYSNRSRSRSAALRRLMSRKVLIVPIIRPSASWMSLSISSIGVSLPSARFSV